MKTSKLLSLPALLPSCAVALGLLCGSSSRAQAPPAKERWQVAPGTLVYLDGRPSTAAALRRLDDAAISSAEGMMYRDTTGRATPPDYLVVTTKAHAAAPTVLALADSLHLWSAYTYKPVSVSIIAPKALAYITSHHPKAWLGGEVTELTRKSTGAVKYRVQLADNWGFRYVSFTAAGDFVDNGIY